MNPIEILKIVDAIHRDKNIDKEIVFDGIEAALVSALRRHYGDEADISVHIDRETGAYAAQHDGEPLAQEEVMDLVGRIGAQTAKQVMIQRIREAERDSLFDEYTAEQGQLVTGVVQRYEGGAATVTLNNTEAILPRSEQIPGETHHANERVRATICDVRKSGSRVKIILSRVRPDLVARLFEQEIPEIADGVIELRGMAREPGYRTKVAVSSVDPRVDCVGACVGVRGNRIKNIVDELAGERIDIVRWSDDMQTLIPNSLAPAEVEEVILCQMLGKAIVLVREDQLSLAIGKRGQNVRLGSKLCGWDIEIMTREELDESIEAAVMSFSSMEGVSEDLAERLVGEGFLSYDELSIIETEDLMAMGGITAEDSERIREFAEKKAEEAEAEAAEKRRRDREQQRAEQAAAREAEAAEAEAAAAAEAAEAAGESLPAEADGAEAVEAEGESLQAEAETVEAESEGESSPTEAEAEDSEPPSPDGSAPDNLLEGTGDETTAATDDTADDKAGEAR